MPGVSKEQIERAREVDVLDYVLTYERDNVRRIGNSYRMKDHPSIEVKPGKWRWYSHGLNGRTALDYLTDVRGYGLVEAVCMLIGESPAIRSAPSAGIVEPKARPPTRHVAPNAETLPEERKPFTLPLRNQDNKRIISYLQSRGIDKQIILDCIGRGVLYENAKYHNCVFVGRDEDGKAHFAALRGIMGDFKCDAAGSDKRYGFTIPPDDPNSQEIAVFESPIDALSHQTLCKQGVIPAFDGWRLSLGGTSLAALTHFHDRHYRVSKCLVCTDNDEAGNEAAAKIAEIPGITVARSPPICGKDWNEALKSIGNEVNLMEDVRKDILFLDEPFKYPEAFRIKDGDSVKVTYAFDGEIATQKCRFIDETHLTVGSNTYHISELAERLKKNGNKVEPLPKQKPVLDILAAKYGEPLQDTTIPMTEAALKRLVGGKYETEVLYVDGQGINGRYGKQAHDVILRGKEGVAVCGVSGENNTPTSLHPYWAQKYKRELSPAERPAQNTKKLGGDGRPSLQNKLDSAKEKAAEHNAANAHGDRPKKRDTAELG